MAADQNLPITGKDVSVEVTVGGIPVFVIDQVVMFTARRVTSRIDTKVIGVSGIKIDQEPEGGEGDFELAVNSGGSDDFIDAVDAAQRQRLPLSIQIVSTKKFRTGVARTHLYPCLKVDYEETTRRGQAVQAPSGGLAHVDEEPAQVALVRAAGVR